jgi:hypothetical protein
MLSQAEAGRNSASGIVQHGQQDFRRNVFVPVRSSGLRSNEHRIPYALESGLALCGLSIWLESISAFNAASAIVVRFTGYFRYQF